MKGFIGEKLRSAASSTVSAATSSVSSSSSSILPSISSGGDTHFFEETLSIERIEQLLNTPTSSAATNAAASSSSTSISSSASSSTGVSDKVQAMKSVLALMSKGQDIRCLFPSIVKNVIVTSVEVKKMIYIYLVHYADADATCRELALLSINTFQKDLCNVDSNNNNPLVRALALKVLTSIRVSEIIQIQILAIKKCSVDESPYVRKVASLAIPKIYRSSTTEGDDTDQELKDVLIALLSDSSTTVVGSAVLSLTEILKSESDNILSFIHPVYKNLCFNLADLDEWGQVATLNLMITYIRCCFYVSSNHNNICDDNDDEDNDDDEDDYNNSVLPSAGSVFTSASMAITQRIGESEFHEDHKLILKSSLPLLKSRNSAVVLAVVSLHYLCTSNTNTESHTNNTASNVLIAKSLMRLVRTCTSFEKSYVVLKVIIQIISSSSSSIKMFIPYVKEFYIKTTCDASYIKPLKLEILTSLAIYDKKGLTARDVLSELESYIVTSLSVSESTDFVVQTITSLGRIAVNESDDIVENICTGLISLIKSRILKSSTSDGDNEGDIITEAAIVVLQKIVTNTSDAATPPLTEQVIIPTLVRILIKTRENSNITPTAKASIIWILVKNPTVKFALDVLRLLALEFDTIVTHSAVKLQVLNLAVAILPITNDDARVRDIVNYLLEKCSFDMDYDVRDKARFIKASMRQNFDGISEKVVMMKESLKTTNGGSTSSFNMGSLSSLVGHVVTGYKDFPEWGTCGSKKKEQSYSKLREKQVVLNNVSEQKTTSSFSNPPTKSSFVRKESEFYSESDDSSEESSESSDSSEEDGESSSEESESDEDNDDDSSEEDDSDSGGSSSGSEEDENDSEEEDGYQDIISSKKSPKKTSAKAPDAFDHFDLLSGGPPTNSYIDDMKLLSMEQ